MSPYTDREHQQEITNLHIWNKLEKMSEDITTIKDSRAEEKEACKQHREAITKQIESAVEPVSAQVTSNSTFIQYAKYAAFGLACWLFGADKVPSWVMKWLAI